MSDTRRDERSEERSCIDSVVRFYFWGFQILRRVNVDEAWPLVRAEWFYVNISRTDKKFRFETKKLFWKWKYDGYPKWTVKLGFRYRLTVGMDYSDIYEGAECEKGVQYITVEDYAKNVTELLKDQERLDWLRTADCWFEDPCDGNWTPISWREEIDRLRNDKRTHEVE